MIYFGWSSGHCYIIVDFLLNPLGITLIDGKTLKYYREFSQFQNVQLRQQDPYSYPR
jgi:hypothetical protein